MYESLWVDGVIIKNRFFNPVYLERIYKTRSIVISPRPFHWWVVSTIDGNVFTLPNLASMLAEDLGSKWFWWFILWVESSLKNRFFGPVYLERIYKTRSLVQGHFRWWVVSTIDGNVFTLPNLVSMLVLNGFDGLYNIILI